MRLGRNKKQGSICSNYLYIKQIYEKMQKAISIIYKAVELFFVETQYFASL